MQARPGCRRGQDAGEAGCVRGPLTAGRRRCPGSPRARLRAGGHVRDQLRRRSPPWCVSVCVTGIAVDAAVRTAERTVDCRPQHRPPAFPNPAAGRRPAAAAAAAGCCRRRRRGQGVLDRPEQCAAGRRRGVNGMARTDAFVLDRTPKRWERNRPWGNGGPSQLSHSCDDHHSFLHSCGHSCGPGRSVDARTHHPLQITRCT